MKVLILTAMWPTRENPAFGSFVYSQARQLEAAGIEVDVLALEGSCRKLIYPKGVFEVRKRLARNSIDLVHAHYGYVGWVARTQWRVPVVVTFHGDDAQGTINENGKTKTLSRVTSAFCRALGPLVDGVIVQTDHMAGMFRGSNVHVIPHEVDLEVFRPISRNDARSRLGLSHEKKYILFAANPEIPVKRFPLAKAACDLLNASDPAVELLVVCKEPQDRLALYMNACNALVFPSYQEGSPNIVKQAMACNLPIVGTDVGDVRAVIGKTEGCYVCPPNAGEFAQAIRKLLRSPARTRGREHVQHLSGPLVAGRVIQVYENTLRKRAKVLAARAQTES
jgi:glycosyltransferase involved in cell wall biosynthesis